jgi:hypothetical protein
MVAYEDVARGRAREKLQRRAQEREAKPYPPI